MKAMTLLIAATTLMLAGCSTDSLTAEAELTYDGSKNGSHSDQASCDAEGALSGDGSIHDGRVQVTVRDGQGDVLYSEAFEGNFDLSKTRLDGHSGSWTLEADREGNDLVGDAFGGSYQFYLNCEGL